MKANQAAFINQEPEPFWLDNAGAMSLGVAALVTFAIGLYVAAALLPGAISSVIDANTTGWAAGEVSLWNIVPLIVVAAFLILILRNAGVGSSNEG